MPSQTYILHRQLLLQLEVRSQAHAVCFKNAQSAYQQKQQGAVYNYLK